ncbi:hypothetical protein L1D31_21205 [Vibrio sp. Isolate23]|uniref:hypothetical protein n=1 Tax=Vibrio sp. Isolate23 TaxID=2908533 RepID=UPI001EFDA1D8|nr:hypothetical protein [Vibrio sp. Isolate23]MCG9685043.1 hypothetical protein [Vibrio sp. Isolate23]
MVTNIRTRPLQWVSVCLQYKQEQSGVTPKSTALAAEQLFWVFNVFEKWTSLISRSVVFDDFDPEDTRHTVEQYYLDDDKLSAMPEKDRLVFMPKFSDYPHIIVHEKVVKVFKKHNVDTLNLVKVSDWETGLQFVES